MPHPLNFYDVLIPFPVIKSKVLVINLLIFNSLQTYLQSIYFIQPIPVAARPKTRVCGRSHGRLSLLSAVR